jgi:hypothetical protein
MKRHASTFVLLTALVTAAAGVAYAHHGPGHGHGHGHGHGSHRARMEQLVAEYLDVVNSHDVTRFSEVFADDYTVISTAGTFAGLPAFTGVMSALYTAMPDVEYTLDEVLVDGDNLTVRYSYTGTHLGPFLGIPASGNTITCRGLEIDRVDGDRLVETQNFTDFHCLLAGMGAL